jgi:hypothetical protein
MNDFNRNEWLKIMKNENKFLLINEIWILTNFLRNRRILRDKWIYKIKRKRHDEILRYFYFYFIYLIIKCMQSKDYDII